MKNVIGIDGCKGGWLAVRHSESGTLEAKVVSSLSDIDPLPDVITIDIPIGLTTGGARSCDRLARKYIGSRASSVFPAPIRQVLELTDHSQANELSKSIQGTGMSQQTVAIMPKIHEIDQEIQQNADIRSVTYEVHPEVTFRAWLGRDVAFAKKKPEGQELRLGLIEQFFGRTAFKYVRATVAKSFVADDDVVDAFAALWSAWRILAGTSECLPDPCETDSVGLRMGIWY